MQPVLINEFSLLQTLSEHAQQLELGGIIFSHLLTLKRLWPCSDTTLTLVLLVAEQTVESRRERVPCCDFVLHTTLSLVSPAPLESHAPHQSLFLSAGHVFRDLVIISPNVV